MTAKKKQNEPIRLEPLCPERGYTEEYLAKWLGLNERVFWNKFISTRKVKVVEFARGRRVIFGEDMLECLRTINDEPFESSGNPTAVST